MRGWRSSKLRNADAESAVMSNHRHGVIVRGVNSLEIAFPGRESQFPGLDRDSRFRPSTYFHLRDQSWGREGGLRPPAGPDAIPGR